jgi:hypothetical protein
MPIPPAQPPTNLQVQTGFSAAAGAALTPSPTQVTTLPQAAPAPQSNASSAPQLIAIDAVAFSFSLAGGKGSQTVTFPQLPYRNNTQNPLAPPSTAAQKPFAVKAIDHLIFTCALQQLAGPNGMNVSLQPVAIDQNNIRCPGPFLGSNVFLTFQVVISATGATSGLVTGTVVGTLNLSCG